MSMSNPFSMNCAIEPVEKKMFSHSLTMMRRIDPYRATPLIIVSFFKQKILF